jgi:sporulation protein YlmC with PRC-barrel domain
MEIPLNAQVVCTDGVCGRSVFVLIDPVTDRVTHVVVKEDASNAEYIVPVESVIEAIADTIRLNCSKAELEKMDPFIKTAFIEEEVSGMNFAYVGGRMGMGIGANYYLPYVSAERKVYESIKQQQIPPGELVVRRGARVEATDGYVGKVDEFVVNPENGDKTHLVMREGHLWGKKDMIIPLSAMGDAHDDTVFLKLNKNQIESQPTFPLKRRWS